MGGLEEIRRELSALQERLDELPPDAFSDRIAVREEQQRLRAEAARRVRELPDDPLVLRQELRLLSEELDRIIDDRGVVAASGASGGPGGDSGSVAYFQELAWKVDEARGRADIEARIRNVRRRLADVQSRHGSPRRPTEPRASNSSPTP